jgi:hypothetical protein
MKIDARVMSFYTPPPPLLTGTSSLAFLILERVRGAGRGGGSETKNL